MIPSHPDYTQKLKDLENELERIDKVFYSTEMKCFRAFEHARPFTVNPSQELEALQEQQKELYNFYGVSSGNLSQLYQDKMKDLKAKENEKRQELNKLQKLLDLVRRENAELNSQQNGRKVTISGSLKEFKEQFEKLRNFYENFKLEIVKKMETMKSATTKLIKMKEEKAKAEINKLNKEITELSQKKDWYENIPQYVKEHSKIMTSSEYTFTIEPDNSKIEETTQKVRQQCQSVLSKHSEFKYDFSIFDNKLNLLQSAINRVTVKANDVIKRIVAQNSSRISQNWAVMAKNLVQIYQQREAINELTEELEAEDKRVSEELKKQTEIANQLVPGTNMTVLQMRKQIVQLSKEVSEETKSLSEMLIKTQEEHKQYEENSRKTIEALEEQSKSPRREAK